MTADILIIGSGAAGLSAALYAGRYRLSVKVFGAFFGGYTSIAGSIENYPGYLSIDGFELMLEMKRQAEAVGAQVFDVNVKSLVEEENHFTLTAEDGTVYEGRTVIFATGTKRRQLGLPHEDALTSKGVHYCTTCDSPLYKGKVIGMVGGGDSAVKGATLALEYCEKLYFFLRGTKFRAEPKAVEVMMRKFEQKIQMCYETHVVELRGSDRLRSVVLSREVDGSTELAIDGLFIEIGADPRVELALKLGVALDELGYIASDALMKTNMAGVFAAGDVVNVFGEFKQDITAAAMGAVAATSAYHYLNTLDTKG